MLDSPVMEYLRELNLVSLLLRYLLAVICGGAIGLEREHKHRPAGFRTHMLVCVGAVTVFAISQYLVQRDMSTDITRLGAQVISGIGFLGAGTIIVTRHQQIRGLTTAAGLWASACIGLALGAGFYEGALVGFALILLVNALLVRLSERFTRESRYVHAYFELESQRTVGLLIRTIKAEEGEIVSMDTEKLPNEELVSVSMELKFAKPRRREELRKVFEGLEGVVFVEEI